MADDVTERRPARTGDRGLVDNADISDRLDAFAAVLELGDANPYTIRAYRRAAETVRQSGVPVAELVAAGRGRELRGIGPGIEARLRELVATGRIAELAELERDVVPDLVGLGRYLGLSAQRAIDIARALEIRTAGELREGGRCRPPARRAWHRPQDRGADRVGADPGDRSALAEGRVAQPRQRSRRRYRACA